MTFRLSKPTSALVVVVVASMFGLSGCGDDPTEAVKKACLSLAAVETNFEYDAEQACTCVTQALSENRTEDQLKWFADFMMIAAKGEELTPLTSADGLNNYLLLDAASEHCGQVLKKQPEVGTPN